VLEHIGEVAYKLDLPEHSRVHPVFHVSQLKQCLGPGQQVQTQFSFTDNVFQVPGCILQQRVRQHGLRTVTQVLIKWSGAPAGDATWEDMEALKQQFPLAPAWGQAGFQERGIVNIPTPQASDTDARNRREATPEAGPWPTQPRKPPGWLNDYEQA
jgi:hypothetical protein